MSTVYVFGHKNPDNDAIMSAVILSQLLNEVDKENTYEPRRLGNLPGESAAMLQECGFELPELLESISAPAEGEEPVKVALTDHTETIQSVDGIENAEVVTVVDHHRISGFKCSQPITFITLPWGSSCSIVYYLFKCYGIEPTDAQLKCLLSAMMTDMVMMKSPTTTDIDRKFVSEIAQKLNIDPIKFGMEIFMNRPTNRFTPAEMVGCDIKGFEVGGKKIYIGQYETVDKTRPLNMIDELYAEMEKYMAENNGDALLLCVTDIMEEGSHMLMIGDTNMIERGLGISSAREGVWMPGVLSRKKQIAAPILAANE